MTQRSKEESLATVIRAHYRLGHVVVPKPVPVAHPRRHRKLIVKTDAGRFLVKTYTCDPYVLDALRFQHRLADHLLKHELPVAQIKRAKSGRRIVEMDSWALELQEFVEGEPMRISPSTLTTAADALGRFHDVCRDFPRPHREARMWRFSEVPRESFARLFEQAKRDGDTEILTDQCNTIALFLHEAGKALDWRARGEFETGLIHGDWHSGNLLFCGEQLVAILDLEFAGEGCFLEDLAYAISNLCIRTSTDADLLARRTDQLLTRYQRSRALSFAEEVAIYYAVAVKHVTTVCCQMEQMAAVAGYGPATWMGTLTAQCKWLSQRANQVRWRT